MTALTYRGVLQAYGLRIGELQTISPSATEPAENSEQWTFSEVERPLSLSFQKSVSFNETRLVTESAKELGVPASCAIASTLASSAWES
jgi:hypothetical protein